ncbi:MAG: hypothetical protein JKX75_03415 [Gammaproteobacteria bacterium]|nr:hypothetical protein [Gammaproteobacteria bacterium]
MKIINFPYLALALGLLLLLIITRGSQPGSDGDTALPLLTLLIINECAFFLTAAGAFIGIKQLVAMGFNLKQQLFHTMTTVLCVLLTIQFALLGFKLWPL